MQTVQFQCGHCRSLMGVELDHLGMQVRCPTCQQVVVAPSSAAPSPPEPASSSDREAEDLFLADLKSAPIGDTPKPSSQPALSNTSSPESSDQAPADPSLPWNDSSARDTNPSSPVARAKRQAGGGGISWLIVLPILSWAILATVVAVLQYMKLEEFTKPRNPDLDKMPDLNGDATMQKLSSKLDYKEERTTRPLPESWKTQLDPNDPKEVQIGSLAVIPLRVEKKFVDTKNEGGKTVRCKHESLVLYLKFRNLSEQFAFVPIEDYFDRKVPAGSVPPFTCLELDPDLRFYGGPTTWSASTGPIKKLESKVADRKIITLAPGGEDETFVCTDGNDEKLAEILKDYKGDLFWRVHVRCGPVSYDGKLVAATAVVGVKFSDSDYRK